MKTKAPMRVMYKGALYVRAEEDIEGVAEELAKSIKGKIPKNMLRDKKKLMALLDKAIKSASE